MVPQNVTTPANQAYVDIDFGSEVITEVRFEAYVCGPNCYNQFTGMYFQIWNGSDWVTVGDNFKSQLSSNYQVPKLLEFSGFSTSKIRIYTTGGVGSNTTNLAVDNLIIYRQP